jgi:hypothetical protein
MTADEFHAWVRTQTEGRYELVDGEPVMMAGATSAGNRRQADGGVDCGTPDDMSMDADRPTMVLGALSLTTRQFVRFEKVEEYKTVPTLDYIVLVDPDCPQCASSAACLTGA